MEERIALGFHTCVDYELAWSTQVVEAQIRAFNIHADELQMDMEVDSERAIWVVSLAHLQAGIGCEIVPDLPQACVDFANHFTYEVTLGGTATRAAIVLNRLGYPCMLQTSCYNEHVERLMPAGVRILPGRSAENSGIFPHVVLQCTSGVRIQANDIDFVTPRENRILISRDADSLNIPVLDEEFGKMIGKCEVFLLGSFTQVLDWEVLKSRIEKTKRLLSHLPKERIVVMEDGCYIRKEFRHYVHQQLAPQINILSMNEDELREYVGAAIEILNPEAVIEAVECVYNNTGIKKILVHSEAWALVYGEDAAAMRASLVGGVLMAATRFRKGDDFTADDYAQTKDIPDKANSVVFCNRMDELLGDKICCVPCKDLNDVESPTVVGLGDAFAGGLLPGLLKEDEKQ